MKVLLQLKLTKFLQMTFRFIMYLIKNTFVGKFACLNLVRLSTCLEGDFEVFKQLKPHGSYDAHSQ